MLIGSYATAVYAYIDPGTGSMLFTILVGLLSVIAYGFKNFSTIDFPNLPYSISRKLLYNRFEGFLI